MTNKHLHIELKDDGDDLLECLGISKKRHDEMSLVFSGSVMECVDKGIAYGFKYISLNVDTPEELAYLSFRYGEFLGKSKDDPSIKRIKEKLKRNNKFKDTK